MFISEAEAKFEAFEQVLATLNKDHPDVAQHIKAEATAREELAKSMTELSRYRSIFGDSSALDTRTLTQQLEAKDGELQKLRLLTEQQAQAETSLFAEIDRLSSLWEGLDQQVKKKLFDLGASEEKLQKAAHEVCFLACLDDGMTDRGYRKPRRKTSTLLRCVRRKWVSRSARRWHASLRSRARLLNVPQKSRSSSVAKWWVDWISFSTADVIVFLDRLT